MVKENKILFVSGEVSGDLHGAALIKELRNNDSSLAFYGVGGEKMRSEGMILIEHINNMAFLGLVEVIKHLPFIRKVRKKVIDVVQKENIRTAVLIDYPGFNLNLAKQLKKMGVKIVYYITPQVWAWGKGRVKTIKKLVDKVLVILPFEKEFFREHGIDSVYVGHPLIERINSYSFITKEEFYSENNIDVKKEILALLPGSREHEVLYIFPEAFKAARKIAGEFGMQIVVACSENIDPRLFEKYASAGEFIIIQSRRYELLKYAKFGIIKSGTSTLEAALLALPMVIIYKTNPLTYFIGSKLVNIKNVGLANIIAGETVVPELIQNDLNELRIYEEIKKTLSSKDKYEAVKNKLNDVKNKLGSSSASRSAAAEISGVMQNG